MCTKQRSFSFADCPANEKIILLAYPFDRLMALSKVEGFAAWASRCERAVNLTLNNPPTCLAQPGPTSKTGGLWELINSSGGSDIVVAKYDTDGFKQWTKLIGSSYSDIGNSIALLCYYSYITGVTYGPLDGIKNNNSPDIFVLKTLDPQIISPVAEFIAGPLSGNTPLSVSFTDQSTGTLTSWSWSFGDGITSTDQNPTHSYLKAGRYTVSLTVYGPKGSHTVTKSNYICVDCKNSGMPWLFLLLEDWELIL